MERNENTVGWIERQQYVEKRSELNWMEFWLKRISDFKENYGLFDMFPFN